MGLNVHLYHSQQCSEFYTAAAAALKSASTIPQNPTETVPSKTLLDPITDLPTPWSNFQGTQDTSAPWTSLPCKAKDVPLPWTTTPSPSVPSVAGTSTEKQRPSRFANLDDSYNSEDGGLGDLGELSNETPTGYRVETHPTAGKVFGKARTTLEDIDFDSPKERKDNMYHPFISSDDFEVAAWLSQSGASMAYIDKFLKLPFVRLDYLYSVT